LPDVAARKLWMAKAEWMTDEAKTQRPPYQSSAGINPSSRPVNMTVPFWEFDQTQAAEVKVNLLARTKLTALPDL
jgi:hypothetical protein